MTKAEAKVVGDKVQLNSIKGRFWHGHKKALEGVLGALLVEISRRGPLDSVQSPKSKVQSQEIENIDFVITTNLFKTHSQVAAFYIPRAKSHEPRATVYIHPCFFELSKSKQVEILYHELISHIYKRKSSLQFVTSQETAFSNEKYLQEQTAAIFNRLEKLNSQRLYLEIGGKLTYDYHAARVLPGFDPNAKIKLLNRLKDKLDVILCIYAGDIEKGKVRSDFGITYDKALLKQIEELKEWEIEITAVVITRFENQPAAEIFKRRLEREGVKVYAHFPTKGFPDNLDLICSEKGFGLNPYIETTKPIVIVNGPGPGSGKLGTCLSQLYHEHKRGMKAAYAKCETFPVWNLPLKHPVNMAYEAATAEMNDKNMIDPYYFSAYNQRVINYNRDIKTFLVLSGMLKKITGKSVYRSPTDMGINKIASGIVDDDAVKEAAKQEIVRRYFKYQHEFRLGRVDKKTVEHIKLLMNELNIDESYRKVVKAARIAAEEAEIKDKGHKGIFCGAAIELKDGTIITGKNSELMHAASAMVLNALKYLTGISDEVYLLSLHVINSVENLKSIIGDAKNVSLHLDEMLIVLGANNVDNPNIQAAIGKLKELRGCEVHISAVPTSSDESGLRRLGLNFTYDDERKRTILENKSPKRQDYPAHMPSAGWIPKGKQAEEAKQEIIDYLGGSDAVAGINFTIEFDPNLETPAETIGAGDNKYKLLVNPNALAKAPPQQLQIIFAGHELFHLQGYNEQGARRKTIEYLIEHNSLSSHIEFLKDNDMGLTADKEWLESLCQELSKKDNSGKVAKPTRINLNKSFQRFKRDWKKSEVHYFQHLYGRKHRGDTFERLRPVADIELSPYLKQDISFALLQNQKRLVYILSGGQSRDVQWLLKTLTGMLRKEKGRWHVGVIIINVDFASLKNAAQVIRKFRWGLYLSNISIEGAFLEMNFFDLKPVKKLAKFLSGRGVIVNGVMHNLGVYMQEASVHSKEYEKYFTTLKPLLSSKGWLQIEVPSDRVSKSDYESYYTAIKKSGFFENSVKKSPIKIFSVNAPRNEAHKGVFISNLKLGNSSSQYVSVLGSLFYGLILRSRFLFCQGLDIFRAFIAKYGILRGPLLALLVEIDTGKGYRAEDLRNNYSKAHLKIIETLVKKIKKELGIERQLELWHINSGDTGGVRDLITGWIKHAGGIKGVTMRWMLMEAPDHFFTLTGSIIHNVFHGLEKDSRGKILHLTKADKKYMIEVIDKIAKSIKTEIEKGKVEIPDVIIVHDPQPLPIFERIKQIYPDFFNEYFGKVKFLWFGHIPFEKTNISGTEANKTWNFLSKYLGIYDALIFQKNNPHPEISEKPVFINTNSIDPIGLMNRKLSPETTKAIVQSKLGLRPELNYVLKNSRFDPHKDPKGEIEMYRRAVVDLYCLGMPIKELPRLILAGSIPSDNFEGNVEVLKELQKDQKEANSQIKSITGIKDAIELIPLLSVIPKDDVWKARFKQLGFDSSRMLPTFNKELLTTLKEAGTIGLNNLNPGHIHELIINALQTIAQMITNKSTKEGFGLSLAGAKLHGKPVIVGNTGGLTIQILHGKTGFLSGVAGLGPEDLVRKNNLFKEKRKSLNWITEEMKKIAKDNPGLEHLSEDIVDIIEKRGITNRDLSIWEAHRYLLYYSLHSKITETMAKAAKEDALKNYTTLNQLENILNWILEVIRKKGSIGAEQFKTAGNIKDYIKRDNFIADITLEAFHKQLANSKAQQALASGGLGFLAGETFNSWAKIGQTAVGFMPLYEHYVDPNTEDLIRIDWDNQLGIQPLLEEKKGSYKPVILNIEFNKHNWPTRFYVLNAVGTPVILVRQPEVNYRLYPPEYDKVKQMAFLGRAYVEFFKHIVGQASFIARLNEPQLFFLVQAIDNDISWYQLFSNQDSMHNQTKFLLTTHTPESAALPVYDNISWLESQVGKEMIPFDKIRRGRLDLAYCLAEDPRVKVINAVSQEHAEVTKQVILQEMREKIVGITNGSDPEQWKNQKIINLEKQKESLIGKDLFEAGQAAKINLNQYLIQNLGYGFDDLNRPTAGLVRRLVAYKEHRIFFGLIGWITGDRDKEYKLPWGEARNGLGMNLLIGGVGRDDVGKIWVERFKELAQWEHLKGKFIFIEGSGINLMQLSVQASDIWISMPRSTREACGTSDSRAAFNGHPNIATYTGGPAEYVENGINGWLIDVFYDTQYSFNDVVSLLDFSGPGKDAVVEMFSKKAQKILSDYLLESASLYYRYLEKGDSKWLRMMQASYQISHSKMHILRMANQYKKVFNQISKGKYSLEDIKKLAGELKDINFNNNKKCFPAHMPSAGWIPKGKQVEEMEQEIINYLGGKDAVAGLDFTIEFDPNLEFPAETVAAGDNKYKLLVNPNALAKAPPVPTDDRRQTTDVERRTLNVERESYEEQLKIIFAGHELFHLQGYNEQESRRKTIEYLIQHNLLENHVAWLEKNIKELKAEKDWLQSLKIVFLGYKISRTVRKAKNLGRPANVLFAGLPGSLKSTIIKIVEKILQQFDVNTGMVDETKLLFGQEFSFKAFDNADNDRDIIFVEMVTKLPQDKDILDLYVELEGNLYIRQERIVIGSGSMEYAQARTSIPHISKYCDKKPDLTLKTDFLDIDFINSGKLKNLLEQGIKGENEAMEKPGSISEGKSAFVGYSKSASQKEADRKAQSNAYGRSFSSEDLKEMLIAFIGRGKGKVHFGKKGINNQEVRELLKKALDNLAEKDMHFRLSYDFGRFVNFLNHQVYFDEIFSDIFEYRKQNNGKKELTDDFIAKLIIFFAIVVHESYHNPRNEGVMPIFTENLEAGLRELEIYILADHGSRKLAADFIQNKFGVNSSIYKTIESLFELADKFDSEKNKNAHDFYYQAEKKDGGFERGVFTGKGRGKFISDVFLSSRGDDIIPDRVREFYQYLLEQKEIGNISFYEVGFALFSICANLIFPGYNSALREELERELADKKMWAALMESYREEIEFGTAGIRGQRGWEKDINGKDIKFLPGPNRINPDTISRYTLAVANYYRKKGWQNKGLVLGFDVRHGSKELAELALSILGRRGVKVYYFSQPRPISEIASAVLDYGACGYIYVTASHNPKTDTGFKIGNQLGAQLFKNQRGEIIREIAATEVIDLVPLLKVKKDKGFAKGVSFGIQEKFDSKFCENIKSNLLLPKQDKKLKVLYDPLFGSGSEVLFNLLQSLDYDVECYSPHSEFNGNFPGLEDHNKNPLNPDPAELEVLTETLEYAGKWGFDIVVATDPDADRCGIAIKDKKGKWKVLRANELWELLVYMRSLMMEELNEKGELPDKYKNLFKEGYVISTWVTSDLIEKISRYFGFHVKRPAVGFSKIAEVVLDEIILPPLFSEYSLSKDDFNSDYKKDLKFLVKQLKSENIKQLTDKIFAKAAGLLLGGFEESNGVSLGGHILEKDGLLAAVVSLEIFEYLKSKGQTPWEGLIGIWRKFGYMASVNIPLQLSGPAAKKERDRIMNQAKKYYQRVKANKLLILTGKKIAEAHRGKDLAGFNELGYKFIFFDRSWLIIRPSGTEAKIRFYGQSEVDSKEFEGRLDEELVDIKELEDRKLEDFVERAKKQIKQEAEGEFLEPVLKEREIIKPVLIFDIDGTIAERNRDLSQKMADRLNLLMSQGVVVAIVTGNPLDRKLKQRLTSIWGNPNLILAVNTSTQIFYFDQGVAREFIGYRKGIKKEDKPKIEKIIQKFIIGVKEGNYDLQLAGEDSGLIKQILAKEKLKIEERVTRLAFRYEEFKEKMNQGASKRVREELADILRSSIIEENIRGYAVKTEGKTTIAIGLVGVDKKGAVDFILQNLGISPQEAVYFGDEFTPEGNDWPVVGVSGLNIFSVGTREGLPVNVSYLGEGLQYTLAALERIRPKIEKKVEPARITEILRLSGKGTKPARKSILPFVAGLGVGEFFSSVLPDAIIILIGASVLVTLGIGIWRLFLKKDSYHQVKADDSQPASRQISIKKVSNVPRDLEIKVGKQLQEANFDFDFTCEESSIMVLVPWRGFENGPDGASIKKVQAIFDKLQKQYSGYDGNVYIYADKKGRQISIVRLDLQKIKQPAKRGLTGQGKDSAQRKFKKQKSSEIKNLISFYLSDTISEEFFSNIFNKISLVLESDEYYLRFGKGKGPIERVEILDYNGEFGRDVVMVRVYYRKEIVTISMVFYSTGYGLDQKVNDKFIKLGLKFVEMYRNFKIFRYKDDFSKVGIDIVEVVKIIENTFRKFINNEPFEYLDAGGDAVVYVNKSKTLVVKELKKEDRDIIKTGRNKDVLKFLRETGCADIADRLENEDVQKGQDQDSGPIAGYKMGKDYLGHLVIRFIILKELKVGEVKEANGEIVKNKVIKRAVVEKFVPVLFKQASIRERMKGCEYIGILADTIRNKNAETAKLLIDQFLIAVRSIIERGVIDWDIKTENYGYDPSVGHIGSLDKGKFIKWHEVTAEQARVFIRNLQIAAKDIYSCAKSEVGEELAKEMKVYFEDRVKNVFRIRDDFYFDITKDVFELERESELEEDLKDLSGHNIGGMPVCYAGSSEARSYSAKEVASHFKGLGVSYKKVADVFAAISFGEIFQIQKIFQYLKVDFIYLNSKYISSFSKGYAGVKIRLIDNQPTAREVLVNRKYLGKKISEISAEEIKKSVVWALLQYYSPEQLIYNFIANMFDLDKNIDVVDRAKVENEFRKIDKINVSSADKIILSSILGINFEGNNLSQKIIVGFDNVREFRLYPLGVGLNNFIVEKDSEKLKFKAKLFSFGVLNRKEREIDVIMNMHRMLDFSFKLILDVIEQKMSDKAASAFLERLYFQGEAYIQLRQIQNHSRLDSNIINLFEEISKRLDRRYIQEREGMSLFYSKNFRGSQGRHKLSQIKEIIRAAEKNGRISKKEIPWVTEYTESNYQRFCNLLKDQYPDRAPPETIDSSLRIVKGLNKKDDFGAIILTQNNQFILYI
ncbi:MAG: HAD-IIB family hydrolase, partial [Candidatus Omnitrophica bacterium]|nr:HAD-IIB family hydrolase [Candidatus Omnitrophota bacterium]